MRAIFTKKQRSSEALRCGDAVQDFDIATIFWSVERAG
ncbi:MAG: hypothetical protein RR061_10020 [Muribaculaceae bacterium]